MKLDHFLKNLSYLPEVFIGTLIVFLLVVVYTRIFGLKSFSKMTGFDFVITVAIGNIIGMTVNTGNPSILTGGALLLMLYGVNYLITYLRHKSAKVEKVVDNDPILLMRRGKVLTENMKKARVTESELQSKLREANVLKLEQVMAVVLETTGDVSVLHTDGKQVDIEDYLLQGVKS
ncbi:DUF421 domain-containing protein [Flavobacteriaceae bacterium TK19130]|nr:DUF421 domain-containing protein [Thermobacterium salinum]